MAYWRHVNKNVAVDEILADLAKRMPSDVIITKRELLDIAGIDSLGTSVHPSEVNDFTLYVLTIIESARKELIKLNGYRLDTIRGEGYKIIEPRLNVPLAEKRMVKTVRKAIQDAQFIATHTRDQHLSNEEKNRKTDALVRMGMIGAAVEQTYTPVQKRSHLTTSGHNNTIPLAKKT